MLSLAQSEGGNVKGSAGAGVRQYVAALAHYRAGNQSRALALLDESARLDPTWQARALHHPVRAMAQHRLGNAPEAVKAFADVKRANIARLEHWHDHVELSLLRVEA